jgi:hypothetical protein
MTLFCYAGPGETLWPSVEAPDGTAAKAAIDAERPTGDLYVLALEPDGWRPALKRDALGKWAPAPKGDETRMFTVDPPSPEVLRALFEGLEASGMKEKRCPCGQLFWSRSDDPRCPPCRDGKEAKVIGVPDPKALIGGWDLD